jgi:hypothetical protein
MFFFKSTKMIKDEKKKKEKKIKKNKKKVWMNLLNLS